MNTADPSIPASLSHPPHPVMELRDAFTHAANALDYAFEAVAGEGRSFRNPFSDEPVLDVFIPGKDCDGVTFAVAVSPTKPGSFALTKEDFESKEGQTGGFPIEGSLREILIQDKATAESLLPTILDALPEAAFENAPRAELDLLAKAALHEEFRSHAPTRTEFNPPPAFPRGSLQHLDMTERFEKACKEVASLINHERPHGIEAQWKGGALALELFAPNDPEWTVSLSADTLSLFGTASYDSTYFGDDYASTKRKRISAVGLTPERLLQVVNNHFGINLTPKQVPLQLNSEHLTVRYALSKVHRAGEPKTAAETARVLEALAPLAKRYPKNELLSDERKRLADLEAKQKVAEQAKADKKAKRDKKGGGVGL